MPGFQVEALPEDITPPRQVPISALEPRHRLSSQALFCIPSRDKSCILISYTY